MACRLKGDVQTQVHKTDKANVSILHWLILMGQLRNIAKTMVTYGFNPTPDDPDIIKPVMKQYIRLYHLIKSREEKGIKPDNEERKLYETITGNIVHDDVFKRTVVKKKRYDEFRKTNAMLAIGKKTKKNTMGGIELLYICHSAKLAFEEVNGDQKNNANLIKGKYKGTCGSQTNFPYRTIALQDCRNGLFKFTDFDPHDQTEAQLLGTFHRLAITVFGKNVRKAVKGTPIDEEATKLTDQYRVLIQMAQGMKIHEDNHSWTLDVEPFHPTDYSKDGKEKTETFGIAARRQQAIDESWVSLGVTYSLIDAVTKATPNSKQQQTAIAALDSYKETVKQSQKQLRFATTKGRTVKGKEDEVEEKLDAACSGLADKADDQIEFYSPKKKKKRRKRPLEDTTDENKHDEEESNDFSCDDAKAVIARLWPKSQPIDNTAIISCESEKTFNDILQRIAPEGGCSESWTDKDKKDVNLIKQQWIITKVNDDDYHGCLELVEKKRHNRNKRTK